MSDIGASISGLREITPDGLVLDAGQLVIDANMGLYTASTTPAGLAYTMAIDSVNTWTDSDGNMRTPHILGATRGGTTIALNKDERQVDADGRRTNIRGFQRVDMVSPELSTTLIEVNDLETLKLALGSTTVTTLTNFYRVRPNLYPVSTDYFANITLFATINGAVDPLGRKVPIAVVYEWARANQISDMPLKDKNEMEMPIKITAHALPTNSFEIPMYVLLPKTTFGYYA